MKTLTSKELSVLTGLDTRTITEKAARIPGAKKINNRWRFPEDVVPWVKRRVRLILRV